MNEKEHLIGRCETKKTNDKSSYEELTGIFCLVRFFLNLTNFVTKETVKGQKQKRGKKNRMLKFLFFGDLLYIIFEDIPSHKFGDSTQETMKEIVR